MLQRRKLLRVGKVQIQTLNQFGRIGFSLDKMYNFTMFTYLVLLTFAAVLLAQDTPQQQFFLSPPLPPTAFLGQFYTVQFRVIGLDNPTFSFLNLPPFLNSQPDGTVSGTPTELGSYPLNITFSTLEVTLTEGVIIRVMQSSTPTHISQTTQNSTFMILHPNITLTYHTGDRISIQFEAINGKKPYLWTFTNLPPGLLANIHGSINGTFIQPGYYTFAVSASDNSGNIVDSYITINVQPPESTNDLLVEVPNRNTPVQYDLSKMEAQQIQATKNVYAAINKVYQLQNQTNQLRQQAAKTTQYVAMATHQYQTSQKKVNESVKRKQTASNTFVSREIDWKNANNIHMLAETNLNNSQKVAQNSIQFAKKAQQKFIQAQTNFTKANQNFSWAEGASIAAAALVRRIITQSQQAYNTYNLTFTSLSLSKTIFEQQSQKLTKARIIVNLARGQVSITESQNDNAQNNLIKMQDTYRKSINAFNQSLQLATNLTYQLKEAEQFLGVAKFNLIQAKNQLFVAQAAKEQADKATAVISMQSATLPKNESSSSPFAGCNPMAYPTMIGSAQVKELNNFGMVLTSGQVVLTGACTVSDNTFVVGDLLSYQGYLKNGQVHALSLTKLVL